MSNQDIVAAQKEFAEAVEAKQDQANERITVQDAISILTDLKNKEKDPIVRKAYGMGIKGLIFERNAAFLVHSIPSDWGVRKKHKDEIND